MLTKQALNKHLSKEQLFLLPYLALCLRSTVAISDNFKHMVQLLYHCITTLKVSQAWKIKVF